jgi:hypothetical protein
MLNRCTLLVGTLAVWAAHGQPIFSTPKVNLTIRGPSDLPDHWSPCFLTANEQSRVYYSQIQEFGLGRYVNGCFDEWLPNDQKMTTNVWGFNFLCYASESDSILGSYDNFQLGLNFTVEANALVLQYQTRQQGDGTVYAGEPTVYMTVLVPDTCTSTTCLNTDCSFNVTDAWTICYYGLCDNLHVTADGSGDWQKPFRPQPAPEYTPYEWPPMAV